MPKVFNRKFHSSAELGPDPVYVGRPSKWGNPFTHKPEGTTLAEHTVASREESITKFEEWLLFSPEAEDLRNSIHELEGKDLICWCAPRRGLKMHDSVGTQCHAQVLMRLANPHNEES